MYDTLGKQNFQTPNMGLKTVYLQDEQYKKLTIEMSRYATYILTKMVFTMVMKRVSSLKETEGRC